MQTKLDFVTDSELNFFPSTEFEQDVPGDTEANALILARNGLRVLMMGWQSIQPLLSSRALNAIFVKRDHALLKNMRLAFQEGFDNLFTTQLEGRTFSETQLTQIQLYLSNCLSLLPFSDITAYESFRIPQHIHGQWQMVDYKVAPIELTPTTGFKQLFIQDKDRVFAYGLEPLHNAKADPHLIFMGTTYPAGQGFLTQVNTDAEAFETAGKKLYRTGEKRLTEWLKKQEKKTHGCGMSLGGGLSLLLAMHQGEKLSRVDVYNPAGIYDPWRKSRFDHWDDMEEKPGVFIQRQGSDVVARFGVWKKEWHVLDVLPSVDKRGPNFIVDHALNYAGFSGTEYTFVKDIQKDNHDRRLQNALLYTFARVVGYYALFVPYRYIVRPPLHYLLNHKIQVAIIATTLAALLAFPVLVAPLIAATATVNAILCALILGALISLCVHFILDKINNKRESTLSHAIDWFKQQSLLTQSLVFIGAVFMIAAPLFTPLVGLSIGYTIAAIPSLISLIHKAYEAILTVFGIQTVGIPAYQDPQLARNDSMDIYTNTASVAFTIKELGEYYQAKRCVLKGKPFMQSSYAQSHLNFGALSKGQVLEKSLDPTSCEEVITIEASKAKLYDIKQTIHLVHRLGFNNKSELKAQLALQESDYKQGKKSQATPSVYR